MPRLNTPTYLHHHHQLKALWLIDQRVFSYLTSSDQLALHRYFQPVSAKTEAELLAHRREVRELDPSLPQRAGRACAKLLRGERAPVEYTELPNGRRMSIRTVMRPEPDLRMVAKAIWQTALREAGQQRTRDRAALALTHYVLHATDRRRADAA